MINRTVLVGRMTRNPELRRTANGNAVTSFTLALNRNYNSADGQQADYIPCVVWNKIAENVERYCSKGSLVGVDGKLQSRSYENSSGQKVFVVEVRCDSVQFLETKKQREEYQTESPVQKQEMSSSNVDFERAFANFNEPSVVEDTFNIQEDDIQF